MDTDMNMNRFVYLSILQSTGDRIGGGDEMIDMQ
jgi:hypothetical protein